VATSDTERGLLRLETEMRRLEAEYNMFFAGRLPRPPWETRSRVDALVKQLDRARIANYGERFRFSSLQARFAAFVELWDRGLRAREEGRPGPFGAPKGETADRKKADDRILCVTAFRDPVQEADKLRELYESISEARREVGAESVPFQRFAELVKSQVQKMKDEGTGEVAFRVAVKDGKVNLTARAMKGALE
jgi:hypothetical protein